MKKLNKIITLTLVATLLICILIGPAGAYALCGYRLINGITSINWSIYNYSASEFPSDYSHNYATVATNSVLSWDTAVTNCGFVRKADGSQSDCNVYFVFGDYGKDGYYGGCWFYDDTGNKVSGSGYLMPYANYDYVIIRCNNYYLQDFSQVNRLRAFFTHELGHAFGLSHVSSTSAIMYPYVVRDFNNSSPYLPQSDDVSGVNSIYN